MKLISVACLAAGMFLTGSSFTLAASYDYSSQPDESSYNRIDKNCRFFDKIVFKIKDGEYASRLYDVKILENSVKDITDLDQAVKDACTRNPYHQSYKSKGTNDDVPCSEVLHDNYEITFVDFAVACANSRY